MLKLWQSWNRRGRKGGCQGSPHPFRQITRITELKGIHVDSFKTLTMCISDAGVFIEDCQGTISRSGEDINILGVHFSDKPDMQEQVGGILTKFRSIIYVLHNKFVWQFLAPMRTKHKNPGKKPLLVFLRPKYPKVQDEEELHKID